MTSVVRTLVIANVLMFFLQITVPILANQFVFVPPLVLFRPWTVITYMFLHGGLMHLAFNMLGLFFFGSRVEDRLGARRFTTLYFLSGLAGAVAQLIFAPGASMVGASAGVFGVMMAFAHYWPDTPIHIWGVIPVPARMLVIGTTVIAIWSGFGGSRSGVAHFAHLGGYAGAYLYLRWLDRVRTQFKEKAIAPPPSVTRRLEGWRAIDLSTVHEVNRDEVNRILDKIGTQGVGSLTPQEKTFLSNFAPPDDRPPPVH